jgi:FAD/FMN-containing dehydrogenase/Fe-S oxidoreductase
MDKMDMGLLLDFTNDPQIKQNFMGELRQDKTSRILYSTDASIYQIEPLGVAFPRTAEDLIVLTETAARYELPILPRGSGSSLAGQAIGRALIIDCSRYMNKIIEVNQEEQTAIVEPGVILSTLNKQISPYQLQFGPDPASAERATIGGCIGNNAAGAHSIIYGMTADHVKAVDVIFSDGSQATLVEINLHAAQFKSEVGNSVESRFYKTALDIRSDYRDEIQKRWPLTWRRASGYNLNYLLPWSPTTPPQWFSNPEWFSASPVPMPYPPISEGNINLAPLIAASEGSLAVISKTKLRLVKKPRFTILAVLSYNNIIDACENVESILNHNPSAVELIPRSLISLARSVPAYAPLTSFVDHFCVDGKDPEALLVVEFSGNVMEALQGKVKSLEQNPWIVEAAEDQKKVWDVRKVGLGILMSRPGAHKPIAFIEDTAVPVNRLGEFVREIQKILMDHNTTAEFYAHASAGCLHIRPILNLKSAQGVSDLRSIAEQTVALTMRLGGTVSAEHGDGIARGEWLKTTYGENILLAFRNMKYAVDPKGILNPGKVVDPPQMDTNLRYGSNYLFSGWSPTFLFKNDKNNEDLTNSIEQCNGAGVCRKIDGVMCPSFQASQDEMHSTRGRANLLRALISGKFPSHSFGVQAVREALDLCLACKGCKSECPSGVDIARLKYEFFQNYYSNQGHRRHLRDYLFGYIGNFSMIGHPFAPVVNYVLGKKLTQILGEQLFGLTPYRQFPKLSRLSLQTRWQKLYRQKTSGKAMVEDVLVLSDSFTEYFQPHIGISALEVLSLVGCNIHILQTKGAGRTLISKGFLVPARKYGRKLLEEIKALDPNGTMPILGIEPSEIYTLRDEFLDLFSDDPIIQNISSRSYLLDEFLIRPDAKGTIRLSRLSFSDQEFNKKVLFHGHCYQKAQPPSTDGFPTGVPASLTLLKSAGYSVQLIECGCCGMAGAFGYEKEHYDFSQRVAEYALFPAIRKAREIDQSIVLCTPGISCHSQIQDGIGITPFHPIQLIANRL